MGTDTYTTDASPARGVLVLEDNYNAGESLREAIEMLGFGAAVCSTTTEALALLDQQHFDLVIINYGPLGENGLKRASTIHRKKPHLPIVLTSWLIDDGDKALSAAGVSRLLHKPFTLNELKQALRGHVT